MTNIVDMEYESIRQEIELKLSKVRPGFRVTPEYWNRMIHAKGFKTLIDEALCDYRKGNEKGFSDNCRSLSIMLYGVIAMNAVTPKKPIDKEYKKNGAQARFREVFLFVQDFARGGKSISIGELENGELQPLRNLKQLHPNGTSFSWESASGKWNIIHPENVMTKERLMYTYNNAKKQGLDGEYIDTVHQEWVKFAIGFTDYVLADLVNSRDLTKLDMKDPEHLKMWPDIQQWYVSIKELTEHGKNLSRL